MATVKQFEDLHVWQEARNLVREVYQITKDTQFRRDFSLRDQITRASTSTMSYRSPLYVALDQNYLDRTTFDGLHASTLSLSRRLTKFINHLESIPGNSRRSPHHQP